MLVSSGPLPADSDRYAFEVKWDGYRALIDASSDGVIVVSRNGLVFTSRYPELQGLAEAVSQPVLLDGESVDRGAAGITPCKGELGIPTTRSDDPEVPCDERSALLRTAAHGTDTYRRGPVRRNLRKPVHRDILVRMPTRCSNDEHPVRNIGLRPLTHVIYALRPLPD